MRLRGTGFAIAAAAALCACGPRADAPEESEAAQSYVYGWTQADTAEGPGVSFVEASQAPGFQFRCIGATRTLRVTTDNPADAAPGAGETARLQLGVTTFDGGAAGDVAVIHADYPLTPDIIMALADAKTARLTFRETSAEAGVDSEGHISRFAQRCTAATGVEPALR